MKDMSDFDILSIDLKRDYEQYLRHHKALYANDSYRNFDIDSWNKKIQQQIQDVQQYTKEEIIRILEQKLADAMSLLASRYQLSYHYLKRKKIIIDFNDTKGYAYTNSEVIALSSLAIFLNNEDLAAVLAHETMHDFLKHHERTKDFMKFTNNHTIINIVLDSVINRELRKYFNSDILDFAQYTVAVQYNVKDFEKRSSEEILSVLNNSNSSNNNNNDNNNDSSSSSSDNNNSDSNNDNNKNNNNKNDSNSNSNSNNNSTNKSNDNEDTDNNIDNDNDSDNGSANNTNNANNNDNKNNKNNNVSTKSNNTSNDVFNSNDIRDKSRQSHDTYVLQDYEDESMSHETNEEKFKKAMKHTFRRYNFTPKLHEVDKKKIAWIRLLQSFATDIDDVLSTYMKENKKNEDLAGNIIEYRKKCVVFCDVSGSVHDEINEFLSLVYKIVKVADIEIHAYFVDTEIVHSCVIKNDKDIKKLRLKVGGGTRFAESLYAIKKKISVEDAFIMFSDFHIDDFKQTKEVYKRINCALKLCINEKLELVRPFT